MNLMRDTDGFLHSATRGVNREIQQLTEHHKAARESSQQRETPWQRLYNSHPRLQQMQHFSHWSNKIAAGQLHSRLGVLAQTCVPPMICCLRQTRESILPN